MLRPYQQQAIDEIRQHYANGTKKVLCHMATGGGKTLIFCVVLAGVLAKGKKAILVVRGKKLVDQASQRLFAEGVPHGCQQGDHWNNNPSANLQICSIDTLYARKIAPEADLIVIDEAHFAISNSFKWLFEKYKDPFYLAVTATPHVKGGLRHIADEVVHPVSVQELIDQGYLVRPRYYVPSKPDLSSVSIDSKTGDYKTSQLADVMDRAALCGNLVEMYSRYAMDRPALAFAVSVEHSQHIVDAFNKANIPAIHVDAKSSDTVRLSAIEKLKSGEIKIISNVGILGTGVDIPCVSCIILARPTKSYNLAIQVIGRGTRIFPGKNDFVVLDHAGLIEEHGLIEDERLCDLDGKPQKMRDPTVTCEKCYNVWDPIKQWAARFDGIGRDLECQGIIFVEGAVTICGHVNATKPRDVTERNTEVDESMVLKEISSAEDLAKYKMETFVDRQIATAKQRGYKAGWVFHKIKDKYGEPEAKKHWKRIKAAVADGDPRPAGRGHYFVPIDDWPV